MSLGMSEGPSDGCSNLPSSSGRSPGHGARVPGSSKGWREHPEVLESFWEGSGIRGVEREYMRFQARRYDTIARFLEPWGPWHDKRIIDIGGGIGGLSVVLHEKLGGLYDVADYLPASPEVRSVAATFGIREYHSIDLTAPDGLAALPGGFDLLLFVEVLEHLPTNPVILFRQMVRLLSPSGRLLITTPNQARLRNRLRLLLGRSVRDGDGYPDAPGDRCGHVVEYTRRDLEMFLGRAGFGLISSDVVQNPSRADDSRLCSMACSSLNLGPVRKLELGDDLLALFQLRDAPSPPG